MNAIRPTHRPIHRLTHRLTHRVASSALAALACAATALLATGCPAEMDDIALVRRTNPPAAKTATVVTPDMPEMASTIGMSDGVVMSVGCWDSCDYSCESPTLSVADGSVLEIRPIQRLDGVQGEHVLVALEPGTTTLTVSNTCAARDYAVTVTDQ